MEALFFINLNRYPIYRATVEPQAFNSFSRLDRWLAVELAIKL